MASPPLVSIVTPTLEAARFLRESAESVLSQSYPNIEYLIVDGGSADETVAIGRSIPGISVLRAPGLTQAQAINFGFAHARGQFFSFLNADDTLCPHAIESAVAALQANPAAPFVYADGLHVDSAGDPVALYPSETFSREALARECIVCQPATLVRSTAFAAAGGVDESLETAFDYDLWIRLAKAGAPVKVDEIWATSRMHEDNKSLSMRHTVYAEVFGMLAKHYGYVPFNWVHAYAGYLTDKKDDFFENPAGSARRTWLTLRMGLQVNRRRLRFLSEFLIETLRLRWRAAWGHHT